METLSIALVGSGMIPIPPPGYGAVEKHIWHLAQALRARGHEVRIVNEVHGPRGSDEFRFALAARRELRHHRYDILHCHTTGVAFTFHLLGPRGYVYTSHSRHWTLRRGIREHVGFALEKRAVRGAERVIALSPRMARLMEPWARAAVVPSGVDTDLFRPDYGARRGNRVVAVGKVEPHKGFHLAAEALEGLDADLTIVGPAPPGPYVRTLRARSRVTLTGEVPEEVLARHLATADVYIHPSSSEAFSLAVIEAMASGLPVVGTVVCEGQVVEGENGFIAREVGPGDPSRGLREAVALLLSDAGLRDAMGRRSRAIAEAKYRWESVATEVERVYRGSS